VIIHRADCMYSLIQNRNSIRDDLEHRCARGVTNPSPIATSHTLLQCNCQITTPFSFDSVFRMGFVGYLDFFWHQNGPCGTIAAKKITVSKTQLVTWMLRCSLVDSSQQISWRVFQQDNREDRF